MNPTDARSARDRNPEIRTLAHQGHAGCAEIMHVAYLADMSASRLPSCRPAPKPGHEHSPPGRSRWARR